MTFLQTDKMKLSVLVVSFLLLVSAFTFLPAVTAYSPTTVATAGPSPAAVTGATAIIDYPIATVGSTVTRTITVTNPTGNPSITSLTISIPKAAASSVPSDVNLNCGTGCTGVPGGVTINTFGSGPWAVVYTPTSASALVPGGAAITLAVTFSTETSTTTSGAADAYALTVSVTDSTNSNTNLPAITVYETAATTVTVTGPTGTLIAGTPFTVKVSAIDSGLPLMMTASGSSSNPVGKTTSATTTISPSTLTTTSSSQSVSVNDTTAETLSVSAIGGTLVGTSTGGTLTDTYVNSANALNILAGPISSVAVEITNAGTTYSSTGANAILNITNSWGLQPLLGSSSNTNNISVSTADKYGNPVKSATTTSVTLTANTYSGQAAGFNTSATSLTYGSPYPYTPSGGVSSGVALTIPANTASVTVPGVYFFGVDYGAQSQLVATSSSGLATGKSAMIVTYTLNANSVLVQASTLSPKAGKSVTINATISGTQQANVPVNFANVTDTTGVFSNGLTSINVTTTVTSGGVEVAAATFIPSTVAGAQVQITAKDALPTTAGVFEYNTAAVTPITLTTQGGSVSSLVVETALSAYAANAGTASATTVTSTGSMYVAVMAADAYGNPSAVSANTQIQLSTTGGLSATLLEIANGYADTVNSTLAANWPSGLSESIFTPTTGSSFTITATATVGGVPLTGSTTISVVSPTPLLSVTGPATLVTGIPSAFSGTANASGGIANNKITSITYSVNGGSAQPVAFTASKNVAFSFSVLLSKTSNVNVTVSDTAGNTNWVVVTVPPVVVSQSLTNTSAITAFTFNNGPKALNATYTNNTPQSVTAIIVANVLSNGAVIYTSTATITVAASGTVSGYPIIQGLPSGTYSVQVTVYSLQYVVIGAPVTISVTV